jgi:hypothetical protein
MSIGSAFKSLGSLVSGAAQKAKGVGLDFSSPGLAFGAGVPTALVGAELAGQVGSSIKEEFTGFDKDLKLELRRQRYEAAQAMRARRLQRAMSDNLIRLATANPQLYNQLMVGRPIPNGAVVIGGGRTDFLESVAYQMATGGFGTPTGSPDSQGVLEALIEAR